MELVPSIIVDWDYKWLNPEERLKENIVLDTIKKYLEKSFKINTEKVSLEISSRYLWIEPLNSSELTEDYLYNNSVVSITLNVIDPLEKKELLLKKARAWEEIESVIMIEDEINKYKIFNYDEDLKEIYAYHEDLRNNLFNKLWNWFKVEKKGRKIMTPAIADMTSTIINWDEIDIKWTAFYVLNNLDNAPRLIEIEYQPLTSGLVDSVKKSISEAIWEDQKYIKSWIKELEKDNEITVTEHIKKSWIDENKEMSDEIFNRCKSWLYERIDLFKLSWIRIGSRISYTNSEGNLNEAEILNIRVSSNSGRWFCIKLDVWNDDFINWNKHYLIENTEYIWDDWFDTVLLRNINEILTIKKEWLVPENALFAKLRKELKWMNISYESWDDIRKDESNYWVWGW